MTVALPAPVKERPSAGSKLAMTQKSEKPPTAMRLFLFAWLVAMPLLDACGTTPVGSNQDAGTERADSGAAQPDVKGTGGVGSGGSTGIGGAGGSTSDARGSDGAGGVPDSGRGGSGGSEIGGGGTDGGSGGGMNDGGTCPAAAPMPTFGEGGPVYQRCASANQVCSYSRSFCECKPPPAGGEANGGLVWICQPIL